MSDNLPVYKSNAAPEQKAQKLNWMYKQLKFIKEQQKEPVGDLVIRCGCHKLQKWEYMYRCLYCGVWYCRECAQEHFGMKLSNDQHIKEIDCE